MPTTTTARQTTTRLHVSLNVRDLERSVRFYETLFDTAPTKLRADYANFELASPAVLLALNWIYLLAVGR